MARDTVEPKLFTRLLKHPRLKGVTANAARISVSRIHQNNPGLTMNAAAYVYAQKHGIGIYGSLAPEDKLSLSYLRTTPSTPSPETPKPKTLRAREPIPELDSQFTTEAVKNASAYPYVYVWENSLRNVILSKFGTGKAWWTDGSKVSKETRDYAEKITRAESKYPWSTSRGDHPIYYVSMVELFSIIERSWSTFKDVFKDLEQLRAWTKECAPIRNLIAHNIPISNVDMTNIKIKAIYLHRMIRSWQTV
jgi:hypothetical protein